MTGYLANQLSAVTLGLEIDFLIALSGEVQEQRSVENLSICLLPSEECLRRHKSHTMIAFAEDDKKTLCHDQVHAVRKQLDLAKDGGLAIYRDVKNNALRTAGVLDKDAVCGYPRIVLIKHLEWEFHLPSKAKIPSCRLRYKQGTFMLPLLDMAKDQKEAIRCKLHLMNCLKAKKAASTIAALLPAVGECDHGAIMIFFEKAFAAKEAQRLTSRGRGLLLPAKKSLFHKGKPNAMLIKRMASIDGAILADLNGNCHAYGVILDGKASSHGKGSKDRGARYNSTKVYVDSVVDIKSISGKISSTRPVRIGVVRSEDGMLDILPEKVGQKNTFSLTVRALSDAIQRLHE